MVLAGFALFIIALLIIGMPVAFTLSLAGILGIIQFVDMSTLSQVPVIAFKTLNSYVLTSVPLYILMSQIMLTGRVGSGLFDLGSKWMGHLPGGLGIATIFACAIFAAISGSSVATAVTIGAMAIPEMLKRGYDRRLVVGSVAAGVTLGILIPPSIPMILYGTITDESVGKLFMSGVMPGALLTLAFVAYIVFASWNKPREERASHEAKMKSLRENIWGLLLPVIIIGGIYTGIFTPTEAAAMSAMYAFIVAVFVYKDMPLKDVPKVLLNSANMSAMLLYIITNAVLFSFIMTNENIPQALADWMLGHGLGVIAFLLAVNVLLLLAGNFMEPSSIVLIFAPILFPVAMKLGIDPVHFGIIMVVNMEVGMCHPPVGLNLYVASGITKMGITELTVAVWPWLLSMLVFLGLVTYWPGLSLWFPRMLGVM